MEIIISTVFIIILGTVNHFVYKKSKSKFLGFFVAINESTWEHMKLIFWPSIFLFIFELFFYKDNPNLIFASFFSILTMLILIPALFYSYKFILKKSNLIIDIINFYLCIIIGRLIFFLILNAQTLPQTFNIIGIIGIIILVLVFSLMYIKAPKNFLFKDPITGGYGYEK